MSKIKMMLDVVEQMRSLADGIEVLAQGIADGGNRPKPEPVPKQNKPAITHEMLRELAVRVSQNGKKQDIRDTLNKYGVKNITAVAEADIESCYADLKALEVSEDAAE